MSEPRKGSALEEEKIKCECKCPSPQPDLRVVKARDDQSQYKKRDSNPN
jgi:hypothetical protein